MKKHFYLFLFVSAFCTLFHPQAQGQPYYNFVVGGISLTQSSSIIRPIDPYRAIAYYERTGGLPAVLALVDLNNPVIVHHAELIQEYFVKDIRVVGSDVFFCGWNKRTSSGMLGHLNINDLTNMSPIVSYVELKVGPQTIMWRLAAYDDGTGTTRVVSLGNTRYVDSNAPLFPVCPPLSICQASFVTEYIWAGAFTCVGSKTVGDLNYFERADDVVVTDNWLAVVTSIPNRDEIAIHRCAKNNVIGTFDNYTSFKVPYQEGVNHCCHMKGDTIADATLYSSNGGAPYESHLRVFDLNTMRMTRAQQFGLLDKAEPLEVVYMPEYATLVSLQDMRYPSGAYHHTFVQWRPYDAIPYLAKLMYEQNFDTYYWLDKLTAKHIIAAGGEYWLMKDISYDAPTTTCYTMANQVVEYLELSAPSNNFYPYTSITINDSPASNSSYRQFFMNNPLCTTP